MKTLRIILGDQLTHTISSLEGIDREKDEILMMEFDQEMTNVPHHPKKIAFLLSARRHFREELIEKKFKVHYIRIDSKESRGTFAETLEFFLKSRSFDRIIMTEPSEWCLSEQVEQFEQKSALKIELLLDNRFFCSINDFRNWAKGKKSLLMENFYRMQRREHHILLDSEGQPEGGLWNYDKENRKPLKVISKFPCPMQFEPDSITEEAMHQVERLYSTHFGKLKPFWFGVTHKQAHKALAYFIEHVLPRFGDYQDAMKEGEYYLFHSGLSQYLNCGLLTPREICSAVELAYHKGKVPINSAEGFIRQILGWREFVRGIYWLYMPGYAKKNALKAHRKLPQLYWGGETKMNCMRCVVKQTEEESLSHHIQRLMVTGNFALLAGIKPEEVCDWYLAVYSDAFDWVELPNTLGMSLFADGGILGTKPYAASGAYINRMSNFCKNCAYDVKEKIGENACPFNFLYWDFLMRHEKLLRANPRMKMVLTHLDRMDESDAAAIKKQASQFLNETC